MTEASTNLSAHVASDSSAARFRLLDGGIALLAVATVLLTGFIGASVAALPADGERFLDSTLGELAVWMTEQATEEAPESWLGRYAQSRRLALGSDELPPGLLPGEFHRGLMVYAGVAAVLALAGAVGVFVRFGGHRLLLLAALLMLNSFVFLIPAGEGAPIVAAALVGIVTCGVLLIMSRAHVERYVGFIVVLLMFTVVWEGSKFAASALDYAMTAPVAPLEYAAYPDLESALDALGSGELTYVLADRNDLRDLMAEYPPDEDDVPADTAYPELRYTTDFADRVRWGRPVEPELPGRVAIAVTATNAETITTLAQLDGTPVGTVTDSFAQTDYLDVAPRAILLDMHILNNLNLPPLQSIAEALLQPARRNGPLLLVQILGGAALYTLTEAVLGFVFGAVLGFVLGSVFAHVALLRRSLLPYVIASQTIPIIAIAPMIVIWLRDTHPILPVAVISAYLTFFPVTINTLRGLQSPERTAFDLLRSYAATPWQIMWKLRFPAALPFIFTALKVSATASVVGAIIGELPSGVRNGLGRAILDFSSDYSLISTPKLWAAIFMAALLGIAFFLIVVLAERLTLGNQQTR